MEGREVNLNLDNVFKYTVFFWRSPLRDSWDTGADPNKVQDQPWSFLRPYRASIMDLIIFKPNSTSEEEGRRRRRKEPPPSF